MVRVRASAGKSNKTVSTSWSFTGDRWFESISLQRRVHCELAPPGFGAEAFGWPGRLLQAREVEREDQRKKGFEQTEEGMVVDMPRPGLRHRPQSPGTAEGNDLGAGRDFIAALRRAGRRIEPVERAPAPIAARDP